jgi:hypothetical protein
MKKPIESLLEDDHESPGCLAPHKLELRNGITRKCAESRDWVREFSQAHAKSSENGP